jgi:hypothetical protein
MGYDLKKGKMRNNPSIFTKTPQIWITALQFSTAEKRYATR